MLCPISCSLCSDEFRHWLCSVDNRRQETSTGFKDSRFISRDKIVLFMYNPAIMDEERVDRCVTKQKKTFSFSIDRILNRDNVKQEDPRRGSHSTLLCCSSPHCREDKAVDTISTRPLQAYQSAFVACQHPICALPTNSRIHTDPYHDFHSPRSYHKYLGLTSVSPRTVCHGDYVRMKETIPYGKRLLMYSRDADVIDPLRHDRKPSPTHDDGSDSKRKGGQVRFSHVQSVELERIFSLQKYISPQERKQLSHILQLSERQVKTWFQNRRAKWRRIKMESEMKRRMAHEKANRQRFEMGDETGKAASYSEETFQNRVMEEV